MAVYRWPTALPQKPLVDGYKRTLPNNLLRSSMDTGSDKVRKRGRFKPQVVSASYVLTATQRNTLEDFVRNSIAEGAICFNWPHPELNKLVRARLKAGSEGILDFSPYKDTTRWAVTVTLEIWPDVKA